MDTVETLPKDTFAAMPEWVQTAAGEGMKLLSQVVRARAREQTFASEAGADEASVEQTSYAEVASLFSDLLERLESSSEFVNLDRSTCYAELLVLYGRALLGSAWNTLEQEAEARLLGPPVPRFVATEGDVSDEQDPEDSAAEDGDDDRRNGDEAAAAGNRTAPDDDRAACVAASAELRSKSTAEGGSVEDLDGKSPLKQVTGCSRSDDSGESGEEQTRAEMDRAQDEDAHSTDIEAGAGTDAAAAIDPECDGSAPDGDQHQDNDDDDDDDARRAWEVLECARTIFAQAGDQYISRVSVCYELLGDLSLYVNDAFDQAAQDYAEAISYAERTEGSHSRRVASLAHRRYVALRSAGCWSEALDALSRAKAILAARLCDLPDSEQSDEASLVQELESECQMVADVMRKLEQRVQADREQSIASAKMGNGRSLTTETMGIAAPPPADAVTVVPRRGIKRSVAETESQTENVPTETNLGVKQTSGSDLVTSKTSSEPHPPTECPAFK